MFRQILNRTRIARMISMLADLVVLIILTELACVFTGSKDIRAVFDMLHELEGMGGDAGSFAEAYGLFIAHFMRLYQTFLKILISYKSVTMMLSKGKTIGMLINGLALVSGKDEEYHLTCLRYLGNALLSAMTIYFFNGIPYIISTFFMFSDENCSTLIERICALKLIESR